MLYNVIVKNKPRISKLITISGNGIENPVVVQVKIGTSLKSVITNFIKLKNTNVVYYANGIMHDEFIDITDFVITEAIDSIIIMQKEIPKSASRCINCGMCEEICPVYLKPLYFIRSPYLKYAKEKCIRCGLCSYICPAHIDFNKSLKENKNGQSTL